MCTLQVQHHLRLQEICYHRLNSPNPLYPRTKLGKFGILFSLIEEKGGQSGGSKQRSSVSALQIQSSGANQTT